MYYGEEPYYLPINRTLLVFVACFFSYVRFSIDNETKD